MKSTCKAIDREAGRLWWCRFVVCMLALVALAGVTGCGVTVVGPPPGAYVGRVGLYDYSPSVIQNGDVRQLWWCGGGNNPNNPSQDTDTIQYATVNTLTGKTSFPATVLAETPGSWDATYVCNPHVIEGVFSDPLGDGKAYTYAMYYVGTEYAGNRNSIGVAFSNDGIHWDKYPEPVIKATTLTDYGFAQPVPYNADGRSAITLFYENSDTQPWNRHFESASSDGIHFTSVGELTTNGLPGYESWGDIAYDAAQGYWYATFNDRSNRPASELDGIVERGGVGVTLYRIRAASLLTGKTPWEQLKTFDTNSTGREQNFIAGLLHDPYGNVNVKPYPVIDVFISMSNPAPAWNDSSVEAAQTANPAKWDIGEVEWDPSTTQVALNEYQNSEAALATTGWVDPNGRFLLKATLGHLYEAPQNGASLAFYGCKNGTMGFFISTDSSCGGQYFIGLEGYGYSNAQGLSSAVPLYSCNSGGVYSVLQEPQCGGGKGALLGFALQ